MLLTREDWIAITRDILKLVVSVHIKIVMGIVMTYMLTSSLYP